MSTGIYSFKKRKGLFQKGHIPWIKGKKGIHLSPKSEFKKGLVPWNKGTKGVMKVNSGSFKKDSKGFQGKHTEKTKKKMSIKASKRKGKNTSNWKGGITPENIKIRRSIESRLWREAVFARDNFTCQKYGVKGGKLHSHHIFNFAQYPELRFAIDNGITFSIKAHKEFHKKYGKKNNTKEQLTEFLNN